MFCLGWRDICSYLPQETTQGISLCNQSALGHLTAMGIWQSCSRPLLVTDSTVQCTFKGSIRNQTEAEICPEIVLCLTGSSYSDQFLLDCLLNDMSCMWFYLKIVFLIHICIKDNYCFYTYIKTYFPPYIYTTCVCHLKINWPGKGRAQLVKCCLTEHKWAGLGIMVSACNPRTFGFEAGRSLELTDHPILGYSVSSRLVRDHISR